MRSDHLHHFPHRPGLHHQLVPHHTRRDRLWVGGVDVGLIKLRVARRALVPALRGAFLGPHVGMLSAGRAEGRRFVGAGSAAMQRAGGSVRDRDQVIGAERLAASVAVELIAAGAEQLAADRIGAGADFQEEIAAVFVVLDRKTFKERVAGGAGGGVELLSHVDNYALLALASQA